MINGYFYAISLPKYRIITHLCIDSIVIRSTKMMRECRDSGTTFSVRYIIGVDAIETTIDILEDHIFCPIIPIITFNALKEIVINTSDSALKVSSFGLVHEGNTFHFVAMYKEERTRILREIMSRFPLNNANGKHLETIESATERESLFIVYHPTSMVFDVDDTSCQCQVDSVEDDEVKSLSHDKREWTQWMAHDDMLKVNISEVTPMVLQEKYNKQCQQRDEFDNILYLRQKVQKSEKQLKMREMDWNMERESMKAEINRLKNHSVSVVEHEREQTDVKWKSQSKQEKLESCCECSKQQDSDLTLSSAIHSKSESKINGQDASALNTTTDIVALIDGMEKTAQQLQMKETKECKERQKVKQKLNTLEKRLEDRRQDTSEALSILATGMKRVQQIDELSEDVVMDRGTSARVRGANRHRKARELEYVLWTDGNEFCIKTWPDR